MSTHEYNEPSIVIGTAGHIDHGKSTLVQALTGTDPDRLIEEKRRGITIELGFARLDLPGGASVGIVDVPGHEKFVRQMIAGATGIDAAILVVAADDGIMPQTREHLAVLRLLSVPQIVVALTKCDMVDEEWVEFMSGEIHAALACGPYAEAEIIPVAAREGRGLDELKAALANIVSKQQHAHHEGFLRMPIDRSFTVKGAGTVVTGSLWSGTIAPGDTVRVLPSGKKTRVRSVQIHGEGVDAAIGMQFANQQRHSRRRNNARKQRIAACARNAGNHRRLEHVAAFARVFAHDNGLAHKRCRSLPKPIRQFAGKVDVRHATHAIGSKKSGHCFSNPCESSLAKP